MVCLVCMCEGGRGRENLNFLGGEVFILRGAVFGQYGVGIHIIL